jgi:hypothetical protein
MAAQQNAVYRLSFTWNKPSDQVETEFQENGHIVLKAHIESTYPKAHYVFQLERAPTTGRLHYQGHLKLAVKERVAQVATKLATQCPGIHISPDSNVGSTQAEFYCLKDDGSKVAGPWADKDFIVPDYSDILEPSGWQIQAADILKGPPEPRHVHWIYEETGCTGKSMFTNYMELYHNICGLGLGTARDNFYAVAELPPKRGYIFDVPRSQPKNFDWADVYMSMEKLKDRNFMSTKYKSKKVFLPVIPHVMIFSNRAPDRRALSVDRWKVWKIENNTLVLQNF